VTFGGSSLSIENKDGEFLRLGPDAINVQYQPDAPPNQPVRSAQGGAFRLTKGRVVMLADANTVAAQIIQTSPEAKPLRSGLDYQGADNRLLLLNIVHWLSGLTN